MAANSKYRNGFVFDYGYGSTLVESLVYIRNKYDSTQNSRGNL